MSNKPLVSVIMPFCNGEKFIHESIASVCAQTHSNWELLLIDDGSTDDSTDIARYHVARCRGKIKYLEHEGHASLGASAARNLGIRNATGDYVAFLDADDVWLPHKLEQQVTLMECQPEAGMLYGATQWWYSWTDKPEPDQRDHIRGPRLQVDTLVMPPTLLSLFLENKEAVPCTCSVLMRRDVIKLTGEFEETFPRLFDDQVFYSKVCLKVPVFVSGECWDKYRQHPQSCCAVAKTMGQMRAATLFYLVWLQEYILTQGIEDVRLWKALQKKVRRHLHPTLFSLLESARRPGKSLSELIRSITHQLTNQLSSFRS